MYVLLWILGDFALTSYQFKIEYLILHVFAFRSSLCICGTLRDVHVHVKDTMKLLKIANAKPFFVGMAEQWFSGARARVSLYINAEWAGNS